MSKPPSPTILRFEPKRTDTIRKPLGLRSRRALMLASIVSLLVLGAAAVPLDLWIAKHVSLHAFPGEVRSVVRRAEAFGHGTGVLFIAVPILLVDAPNRKRAFAVLASAFGAGLAADFVKLFIGRMRPTYLMKAPDESHLISLAPWLTTGDLSSIFDRTFQSCPSAHTATAFGLAFALGKLHRPAAPWFLFLASLVAIQRIAARAHFLSDTIWGAAVGLAVSYLVLERLSASQSQNKILTFPSQDYHQKAA